MADAAAAGVAKADIPDSLAVPKNTKRRRTGAAPANMPVLSAK
jgi:hypothetical protein